MSATCTQKSTERAGLMLSVAKPHAAARVSSLFFVRTAQKEPHANTNFEPQKVSRVDMSALMCKRAREAMQNFALRHTYARARLPRRPRATQVGTRVSPAPHLEARLSACILSMRDARGRNYPQR